MKFFYNYFAIYYSKSFIFAPSQQPRVERGTGAIILSLLAFYILIIFLKQFSLTCIIFN